MNEKKMILNQVVEHLPPSGIRAFFDLVLEMDEVISLGVGEPDFPTPWHISQHAIQKIEQGFTTYASNSGLMELRVAIAEYLKNRYSLEYDPGEEILITVGVSEAVDLAFRALLNPGDEVLIHEPCYVAYKPGVLLAGGVPRMIRTEKKQGFKVMPEMIEEAITPKTKALLLNYPCNPTGTTYTREELEKIAGTIDSRNLFVITDEIYHQLSFDHEHFSIGAFPGLKKRVLYLNGFSKGYAMTGWRVGYACGPRDLVRAMTKIHQYTIMCVPIMGQFAAIEALKNGEEAASFMKEEYRRRRNFLVKKLNQLGLPCHKPGGAFYMFPEIPKTFSSSAEFAGKLLKDENVAVVPGSAFEGGEGHIRISYASSMAKLETAMSRIENFLKRKTSAPSVSG